MSSSRVRRLATVATTAMLGALLFGTGTVVAATPGWNFTDQTLIPDTVSPGSDAGYSFTIVNQGKSNISQLYLVSDSTQPITYLDTSRGTTMCQTTPYLKCAFGALNAGATIKVVIAYTTPTTGGTFSPTFGLNGTGNTPDPGGNSHGDTKTYTFVTTLNSSPNFAGGFQVAGHEIGTYDVLSKKNPQSTKVDPGSAALLPVTVEDGITTFPGTGTDPCASTKCLGDWAKFNVKNGSVGPIKVTIVIYGGAISGNPATTSIGLWHEGSSPNPIILRCSDPTSIQNGGSAECVTVTKVGQNYQIVAWLTHNGTGRGVLFG